MYDDTDGYDDTGAGQDDPESGRHPVSISHLVMGIAFAGLLVIWALFESNVVADSEYRWLLPLPWLVAGAAGVVASVLTSRK